MLNKFQLIATFLFLFGDISLRVKKKKCVYEKQFQNLVVMNRKAFFFFFLISATFISRLLR